MSSLAVEKTFPDVSSQPLVSKAWIFSLIGLLLLSYAAVLGIGLSTPVSLGDEVYHYRFAKANFILKERATVDLLYSKDDPTKIRFVTDPGWPLTLSYLWQLYGKISPNLAQIYHSLYFLILLAGTYLLAAHFYSMEVGLWSALLVSTMPMLVSFGILFYSDLPATALFVLVFFLFCRRNFLSAGILLASAYLIKKGVLCFLPALLPLAIFFQRPDKKKIILALFSLLIPLFIFAGLEMSWQVKHLPSGRSTFQELNARLGVLYQGKKSSRAEEVSQPIEKSGRLSWWGVVKTLLNIEFSNSHILKWRDDLKYFGIVMPVLLFFSLFKAGVKKPAWILILPVAVYTAVILFLCLLPDIRYFMPLAPFLCIFAARSVSSLKNPFFKGVIIFVCTAQLFAAAAHVYRERQISKDWQESFDFIQTQVPEDALFLNPDLMILEYANRRIVWGLCDVRKILWGTDADRKAEIERIHLDYIAVKKSRIYEDAQGLRHIGGYPQSFLEILKKESFASPIFENQAMSLWKINREKIS